MRPLLEESVPHRLRMPPLFPFLLCYLARVPTSFKFSCLSCRGWRKPLRPCGLERSCRSGHSKAMEGTTRLRCSVPSSLHSSATARPGVPDLAGLVPGIGAKQNCALGLRGGRQGSDRGFDLLLLPHSRDHTMATSRTAVPNKRTSSRPSAAGEVAALAAAMR